MRQPKKSSIGEHGGQCGTGSLPLTMRKANGTKWSIFSASVGLPTLGSPNVTSKTLKKPTWRFCWLRAQIFTSFDARWPIDVVLTAARAASAPPRLWPVKIVSKLSFAVCVRTSEICGLKKEGAENVGRSHSSPLCLHTKALEMLAASMDARGRDYRIGEKAAKRFQPKVVLQKKNRA